MKKTKKIAKAKLFDVNNEQVILASMIKSKPIRRKVCSLVGEQHFVGKRHKTIFTILKSMQELEFNEDTFDAIAEGEEYGGYEYLKELQKYYDVNSNIEIHVKKLIKDSVKNVFKNKIVPELEEMIENPSTELEEIQDILNKADYKIKNSFIDDMVETKEALKKAYKAELKERSLGVKDVVGFGFEELDSDLVEGALPGKVITITARPSMGKTTFSANCTRYWTQKLKKKVLACPLETGKANLLDYMVVQRANETKNKITLKDILTNMKAMDISKKHKINKTIDEILDDGCLSIADSTQLTLGKLRVMLENGDYDICVIDLFEKLADVTDENLSAKLDEVQKIAKDTKTCMVIVSQLRRLGKQVADKKPDLEQIKNSGKYEEVSDLVIGLYREHYYNKEADDVIEVIVLKQRNGLRNYSASYEFLGYIATIGDYKELDEGGW